MLRDLLSAGRVANLPTVWSNILCGSLISAFALNSSLSENSIGRLNITLLTGSLLYLGGCFFNDYFDRYWDAEHKPSRALPSGRISPNLLLVLTITFLMCGLVGALYMGKFALISASLICLFIWIYTLIHKKTAWGILPMGACRAGLYFLGFSCIKDTSVLSIKTFPPSLSLANGSELNHLIPPALALLLFISGITLVARSESKAHLPKWAKYGGLLLIFSPVLIYLIRSGIEGKISSFLAPVSCVIFIVTIIRALRKLNDGKIGAFVSLCLASICLVDMIASFTLGNQPIFYLLIFLALHALSLALQRLASAT